MWIGYWWGQWAQGRRGGGAGLRPPRGSDAAAGTAEQQQAEWGGGEGYCRKLFGADGVVGENV